MIADAPYRTTTTADVSTDIKQIILDAICPAFAQKARDCGVDLSRIVRLIYRRTADQTIIYFDPPLNASEQAVFSPGNCEQIGRQLHIPLQATKCQDDSWCLVWPVSVNDVDQ